jgi:small subunit ribosomal protein S3Ae
MSDLMGHAGGDYYRAQFLIDRIDKNAAFTRFNGYTTLKEHIMRVVRKRTQKIESVLYIKTKDNWKLQISMVAILNRNTETAVKKKVRAHVEDSMKKNADQATIDEFVKSIFSSHLQRKIKKSGSKVYPIRFVEISKIEVKEAPQHKDS